MLLIDICNVCVYFQSLLQQLLSRRVATGSLGRAPKFALCPLKIDQTPFHRCNFTICTCCPLPQKRNCGCLQACCYGSKIKRSKAIKLLNLIQLNTACPVNTVENAVVLLHRYFTQLDVLLRLNILKQTTVHCTLYTVYILLCFCQWHMFHYGNKYSVLLHKYRGKTKTQ